MGLEFRLLDDDGVELISLPDVESFTLSPVLCDRGALEFSYPRDGINWEYIHDRDEFRVTVYLDGVREPALDAWVQQIDGDDVTDGPWKFTGHFNNGRLAEARVYPKNWPNVDPLATKQQFVNATPGTIVKTLMQQAQARGTLPEVTMGSFTGTKDSSGVDWPLVLTVEYAPQLDYLAVVQNLHEQRLIDFQMVGNDLRLYVFDSMAVDRTLEDPPLVFRKGRDLTDSPRKRSARELGTVMLASGSDGLFVERVDAPGIASRRRIEKSASQGQVKDLGTLTAYADAELTRVKQAKMEKTHGLIFGESNPRPIRNFNVGDWAHSDMGEGLERLRIKQWVLKMSSSGELSGSVSLNDLFAEQDEVLSKRVEGIIGGSTITGGSQAVVPDELVDGMPPATPTSPSLSSSAYMDNQGHTFAQVSASWLQVTTNADGTILEDLEGYLLRWRQVGDTSWQVTNVGNTTIHSWSPVAPGINIEAQIQAYDRAGNSSAWSGSGSIFTGTDATPPEQPSAPAVDNYLGLLRIHWNGKSASGAVLAPDFKFVEVHISAVNNFTPDATTRFDTLSAEGESYAEVPYGSPRFVKLVAVDHTGNTSPPSPQASASTSQILGPDIFDGAVGSAKIADLAIVTAKIADLAVNDAKIGSVSVGKLTAGVINAQVTISGRIATALTGARREMNGIGFQAWNASEQLTINLDGINNLLTGIFRTAITGRRIEIGSAGKVGELTFIAPDGKTGFMRVFTESAGIEAMQFGLTIPSATAGLWNRINLNSDEWATSQTNRWDWMYGESTGFFRIGQITARTGANYIPRFYVDASKIQLIGADTVSEHAVLTNEHLFTTGSMGFEGAFLMQRHLTPSAHFHSPRFIFRCDNNNVNGAGFHQTTLWFLVASNNTDPRLEVRNGDNTDFNPIKASAFQLPSSIAGKKNIRPLEAGALDRVRATKVKKYQRTRGGVQIAKLDKKGDLVGFEEVTPAPETLGIVAEESPAEILTPGGDGIDLYAMVSFLWAAVGELGGEVDGLKGGKP